jgi:DNA-binding transcriptional ArsR family regulator
MNVEEMRCIAGDVSDLLKILANPNRLMALCELVHGELSVGELARKLGVRDQAMSQQLSILRARGLVETRREGQTIYYSLARDDVKRIIRTLYELFCAEGQAKTAG